MGLDAFVPCHCWEDGLTADPPVDRSWIARSDGMLDLAFPHDDELWSEFAAWTHGGRSHVDMEVAAEHIGNWSGYRQFQWALGAAGWERFPVLRRVLPDSNGGEVSPVDSAAALGELAEFAGAGLVGVQVELYDGTSGAVIATESPAYGYRFIMSPECAVGLDAAGLFVIGKPSEQEIFRARRTGQRLVDDGRASLSDLDHPERGEVVVPCVIADGAELLLTRSRPCHAHDFAFTVEALAKVFAASVEFGSPVFWA
jgi:hypothetical protein